MIHALKSLKYRKAFCGAPVTADEYGPIANVECLPCLEAKDKVGLLGFNGRRRLRELRQAAKAQNFGAQAVANGAGPLVSSGRALVAAYAKKPDSRWNTVCRCGKPAYQGFTDFECSGGCK